ncbi:AWPM-19-like family protein [Hibiscus syriacus]|uniref:AWPM-19-like family protein n=1 Tax=Hibiscus syriacus TaxID=106335 RepID=A0A6A3B0L3_HIBSY|nr:AWPM-19-like family protein [Hibiscus syriacus]
MKDFGSAKEILRMQIHRDRSNMKIWLSQKNYLKKILSRFNMQDCKLISTILPINFKLSSSMSTSSEKERMEMSRVPYASTVGSLMFTMICIRPDIAQSVGMVVDSDYAEDLDKNTSTTRYVFKVAGGAVTWVSKLQSVVTTSTTEVEYVAATQASKEVIWLKMLLEKLGHNQEYVFLFCNSQSALHLARNPTFHSRTKHIRVQYHFIREKMEEETVDMQKIHTKDNITDFMTKTTNADKFSWCRTSCGLSKMQFRWPTISVEMSKKFQSQTFGAIDTEIVEIHGLLAWLAKRTNKRKQEGPAGVLVGLFVHSDIVISDFGNKNVCDEDEKGGAAASYEKDKEQQEDELKEQEVRNESEKKRIKRVMSWKWKERKTKLNLLREQLNTKKLVKLITKWVLLYLFKTSIYGDPSQTTTNSIAGVKLLTPKLEPKQEPFDETPPTHFQQQNFLFSLSPSTLIFLLIRNCFPSNVSPSTDDQNALYSEYFRISELFRSSFDENLQKYGDEVLEPDSRAIVPVPEEPLPSSEVTAANACNPDQALSVVVSRRKAGRSNELVRVTNLGIEDEMYFRDVVRRTRMMYDSIRILATTEEEKRTGPGSGRRARGDLRAAANGALYDGVTWLVQAGIDYLPGSQSSNGQPIATSIIVSGGYEDDQDAGDTIIYTGHGGRDKFSRHVCIRSLKVIVEIDGQPEMGSSVISVSSHVFSQASNGTDVRCFGMHRRVLLFYEECCHSSRPNVLVQYVLFDHDNLMFLTLLFAMENIPPMRELSIDYAGQ